VEREIAMIDPAVKIAMVVCVMLGGVCVSLLFRHDSTQLEPHESPAASAMLEPQPQSPAPKPARAVQPSSPTARNIPNKPSGPPNPTLNVLAPSATVIKPAGRLDPPPRLSESYPEPNRNRSSSSWGTSMSMLMPGTSSTNEEDHTHTVVDGDTLPALAEQFLGSANRAQEIFEANRDLLSTPSLLPIGVELKIPPRGKSSDKKQASTTATP
jgi:nucleoid-associated protein YgaU